MATCSTVFCGICDAQHIKKNADSWCPECEEGFCSECLKHHNVSKYNRSHEVISIENYQKLPQIVSKIVHHCPEHKKRYQNYCKKHESLCCPLCISTNHKECVGLLAIEELIKSSKTSTVIDNMEQSLKDLAVILQKVIKDRKDNLINITKQRQTYQDEIKQIRKRINDHLDKLEGIIIEDLIAAEKKIKSETENLLSQMKEKLNIIEELQSNLSAVKTYASDLQTFLSSKTMQAEVDREEKYMQSLPEDDRLKQISMKLRIDDRIANMLSTITSFGSISTAKGASFTFKFEKDKQANFFTAMQPVGGSTIGKMNLKLVNKFEIPKGTFSVGTCIRGCVIISKGKLIVVDSIEYINTNNRLLILKSDGMLDVVVPLSLFSVDVTSIDDNHVAVSTGSKSKILVINTESKTIKRTISTACACFGLTHREGKLFYIQYGSIQEIDLNSDAASTFVKDTTITDFSRITTYTDKIYYTNKNHNTVTCCKVTGEIIWQFKDKTILAGPIGIGVDAKFNIYVASRTNNSVVVISPDGRNSRRILGKEDGIDDPFTLYVDKVRNHLVVTNFKGKVLLYSVT